MTTKSGLASLGLVFCAVFCASLLGAADWGAWQEGGLILDSGYRSYELPMSNLQQFRHVAVPDGSGGVFATWIVCDKDAVIPYIYRVYAQHISASGDTLWGGHGVLVRELSRYSIIESAIVPAGNGEVIVCWNEDPGLNIKAQRLDASGNRLWNSEGVLLCDDYGYDLRRLNVASDGAGGALVSCVQTHNMLLMMQRVNARGDALWDTSGDTAFGLVVDGATVETENNWAALASPGGEGAIVTWADQSLGSANLDIYAQKVDTSGAMVWDGPGVGICTATGIQKQPVIESDDLGGAFVAWEDGRTGGYYLYAQKIDENGEALWTPDGAPVSAAQNTYKKEPVIVPDGAGGVIIAWKDYRSGDPKLLNVYAQRIDGGGDPQWTPEGVAVCCAGGNQEQVTICSDGAGGAIISWIDQRNGQSDVFAQRLDMGGNPKWKADGIPICTIAGDCTAPYVCNDGGAGALAYWHNYPGNFVNITCFVQRIDSYFDFTVPSCSASYRFFRASDGQEVPRGFMNGCPAGEYECLRATLEFDANDLPRDIEANELTLVKPDTLVTFWSVGDIHADSAACLRKASDGKIITTITQSHFSRNLDVTRRTLIGRDVCVLRGDDFLGALEGLTVKSPDYTGDGNVDSGDIYYFGMAFNKSLGQAGYNAWFDFTDDAKVNLADYAVMGTHYNHHIPYPYQPLFPVFDAEAGVKLIAREGREKGSMELALCLENAKGITTACIGLKGDLGTYEYRGFEPSAEAGAATLVAPVSRDGVDVLFVSAFFAEPSSGNEIELGTIEFALQDPAGLLTAERDLNMQFGSVRHADGTVNFLRVEAYEIEATAPRPANYLADAYPNPFNPTTTIDYSIADETPVNLSIYDVNGRLIRTLVNGTQKSKAYSIIWDGQDHRGEAVQSGIYFYRIKTNNFVQSKKLVLLR